jgi:DNA-binding CsgD family transcriptional regulator
MSTLTSSDLRCILSFLQELHTLCDLENLPDRVISTLPKVIASELTGWSPTSFSNREILAESSYSAQQVGSLTSQDAQKIGNRYFSKHPLVRHYIKTHDGSARTISDFLSEEELHRFEELYQYFLRPLGMEEQMIAVLSIPQTVEPTLLTNSTQDIVVVLHRSQRNFSERDRLILNLLRPHLVQAYQNAQALTQIQQQLTKLNRTIEQLGTIFLSTSGQIQFISQRASQLLAQYFQSSMSQTARLPELLQNWINYQLSRLYRTNEMLSPCLPLKVEREGKQLIIRLIDERLNEQYLLLLEEQLPSSLSPKLLELLGLTRRESEVLFWVAKDKNTREIGSILGMSDRTVKKHLEHIYEKFGVQTRAAAVVRALEKLGLLTLSCTRHHSS